ncbi:MAG: hypothetical protein ACRBBN_01070 [Methyloligellaceae bacterium]
MPAEEPIPEPEVEEEAEAEEEQEAEIAVEEVDETPPHEEIEAKAPEITDAGEQDIDFRETMADEDAHPIIEEEKFEAIDDSASFGAMEQEEEPEPEFEPENFGAIEEDKSQEPEPEPEDDENDPFIQALRQQEQEEVAVPPAIPVPPTMVSAVPDDPRKVMIGWAAFSAAVFVIFLSAYMFRVGIVKRLPTSAHIYAALGIDVNVRGLKFEGVEHKWDTEAGRPVLRIAGEIVNVTNRPIQVPTIVFAFRDKSGAELYYRPKKIEIQQVMPRKNLPFAFKLLSPSELVHSVELRFADGGNEGS